MSEFTCHGCSEDTRILLGEIKAKTEILLANQERIAGDVSHVKSRLTTLEVRAATIGGMAGSIIGIGLALLSEKIKHHLLGL